MAHFKKTIPLSLFKRKGCLRRKVKTNQWQPSENDLVQ